MCLRKDPLPVDGPKGLRFYNAVMRSTLLLALSLICLPLGQSLAQTAQTATPLAHAPGRVVVESRVEHLRLEDSSVRIDEVRVGGQTQHITVQPKNMPTYELGTHSSNRNPATDNSDSGQTSSRGWKVLGF